MPLLVREDDLHIGHASSSPNPFHRTAYIATKNSTVFVNNKLAIVVGDKTACTDPAVEGSPNVFINNFAAHRLGDATGGHASWRPNAASQGSPNVIVN